MGCSKLLKFTCLTVKFHNCDHTTVPHNSLLNHDLHITFFVSNSCQNSLLVDGLHFNVCKSLGIYLFFSILWCWFVEGSNHQAHHHSSICLDKWIALLFLLRRRAIYVTTVFHLKVLFVCLNGYLPIRRKWVFH